MPTQTLTLPQQYAAALKPYRGRALVTLDGQRHRIALPSYEEGYRIGSLASRLTPWEALDLIDRAIAAGCTLTEKGR